MGKDWEAKQVDRLVKKQQEKIASLQEEVEKDYPLPSNHKYEKIRNEPSKRIRPDDLEGPINS